MIVNIQDCCRKPYSPPGLVVRDLNLESFCESGSIDGYHDQDDYDWGSDNDGQG